MARSAVCELAVVAEASRGSNFFIGMRPTDPLRGGSTVFIEDAYLSTTGGIIMGVWVIFDPVRLVRLRLSETADPLRICPDPLEPVDDPDLNLAIKLGALAFFFGGATNWAGGSAGGG